MIVPLEKIKQVNQGLESLMLYMTEEELDLILLAIKSAFERIHSTDKVLH